MMRHGFVLSSYPATAALERALLLSAERSSKSKALSTAASLKSKKGLGNKRSTTGDDFDFPVIEWPEDSPHSVGGIGSSVCPHTRINLDCPPSKNMLLNMHDNKLNGVENQGLLKSRRIFSGLSSLEEAASASKEKDDDKVPSLKDPNFYVDEGLERLLRISEDAEVSQVYVCA